MNRENRGKVSTAADKTQHAWSNENIQSFGDKVSGSGGPRKSLRFKTKAKFHYKKLPHISHSKSREKGNL
jgi:hypothetical protein